MNLPDSDHDLLTRFLLPHAGVRGVHVRLHGSWQELLSHASYPPAATRLLGEACAAAAMLTAHVKVEGRLSLQLRAEAQLKLLFAECTAAGTVRGIAQLEDGSDAPADLQRLVNPVLAITIENPGLDPREPLRYQSLVELASPVLDEVLGFRPDYIEHQLAHAVRDPNGRAYNRTSHLPERRKMMQEWADYLDALRLDSNVVPIRKKRYA